MVGNKKKNKNSYGKCEQELLSILNENKDNICWFHYKFLVELYEELKEKYYNKGYEKARKEFCNNKYIKFIKDNAND